MLQMPSMVDTGRMRAVLAIVAEPSRLVVTAGRRVMWFPGSTTAASRVLAVALCGLQL
jgi:hypothetical protein